METRHHELKNDLEAAWAEIDEMNRDDFVERIHSAVNDPSVPPEIRGFEIACAEDSTGRSDLTVDGYRRALSAGLAGYRGRRTKIQLTSSLRNLGQSDESVRILTEDSTSADDGVDDADAASDLGGGGFHVMAVDGRAAGRWLGEYAQGVDECRLARAVGSQEFDYLATLYVHENIV